MLQRCGTGSGSRQSGQHSRARSATWGHSAPRACLENVLTAVQTTTPVAAVEQLVVNARNDLALIIVRRDQVASVVAELADNRGMPTLLFMLNTLPR